MNHNTKGNFNQAKKLAAKGQKEVSFDIPIIAQGGWATYKKTFHFKTQPKIKKFAKVAAKKSRVERILDVE